MSVFQFSFTWSVENIFWTFPVLFNFIFYTMPRQHRVFLNNFFSRLFFKVLVQTSISHYLISKSSLNYLQTSLLFMNYFITMGKKKKNLSSNIEFLICDTPVGVLKQKLINIILYLLLYFFLLLFVLRFLFWKYEIHVDNAFVILLSLFKKS